MNSSFALKSLISYSFTDATNFKGKGTAGCTSSLAPTTHLLLYILTNCTSIYTIGTESTFVKTSAHIILRVSIGKRILPMKTHSRAICLQPSPANTVKRAPVDFTAPVIPSASSRNEIEQRQNHTTTKTYQPQTKPQRDENQHPPPQPHSWFVPVFSVILLSASHLPGWAGPRDRKDWDQSPSHCQRFPNRVKSAGRGPGGRPKNGAVRFCSVLRKHDRERQHVAWEPQGIGTELAVKHVCTHQTRVDSKKHSVLGKFFGYKERHSATSAAKRDLQPHSQARPSLSSACVLRDRPSCFVRKPSTLRFSTNHFYPFQCAVLSLQTYYRYTFHIHNIYYL